jgi:hypothetical protein
MAQMKYRARIRQSMCFFNLHSSLKSAENKEKRPENRPFCYVNLLEFAVSSAQITQMETAQDRDMAESLLIRI